MLTSVPSLNPEEVGAEGAGRRLAVSRGRWAPTDKMGESGRGRGVSTPEAFTAFKTAFKGGGESELLLAVPSFLSTGGFEVLPWGVPAPAILRPS